MASTSTFGSDPDRLRRLLSVGLEKTYSPRDKSAGVDPLDLLLEQPGVRIGRYEILEVLGEGGMGVVYLAQQHEPIQRQVALKVIKPGMDTRQIIARFQAEQQTLAILDHPHVARVYDGGLTSTGRPYFVMEYVDGVPITDYCDAHRLSIRERLVLFLPVCEAVQHAHQKGIIHRDLKPSNILIAEQNGQAIPKVIDFGVARALSRSPAEQTLTTASGQIIGTPAYMSPEQANINNPDIDIRSDIYALGVLLCRLLAGRLPFEPDLFREGGIEQIRRILMEQEPKSPSALIKTAGITKMAEMAEHRKTDGRTLLRLLRGDLDWIVLKAMEKDRVRRYPTVDAFAHDIRRHLRHEPISAAPPQWTYVMSKFVRRHQVGTVGAVAAIAVTAGLLLSTAMYVKALRADRHADSLEHNRLLAEARELFVNRQYDQARSRCELLRASRHVGRAAQLLHARTTLELQDPTDAISELEAVLGPSDEIAGHAHFLLARIYDDVEPAETSQAAEYHQRREYHRRQAERLVPVIARHYFLRRQISLTTDDQLNLLRSTLELDPHGIFGKPVNAGPTINSPHAEWYPSISADDRALYFVSDRPGGPGNWDIWMATRPSADGDWSVPVNLGPPVNTSASEWFPSISADGLELYFCRGDWGQGDLYVATRRSPDEPWQAVAKLPDGINVADDDYSPLISFDGLSLYFISKRLGGPGDIDIWLSRRSTPDVEWGCPEPLPWPINSPHKEGHKCLSSDGLILFFQRFKGREANRFLYATTRETKKDPWSPPINLGPVPIPDSSVPAVSSLSHDGTRLYFFEHPFFAPLPGGQGQQDIWYLPIDIPPTRSTSSPIADRSKAPLRP